MKKYAPILAILLAQAALAGEPPTCGDPAVTKSVQELFWEQKLRLETSPGPQDGNAWRAFNDFTVSSVVTHGYDTGLRRRACEGGIGKGRQPWRVPYTVQATDDAPGRFVVRADFRNVPDDQAMALRELIVRVINQPAR